MIIIYNIIIFVIIFRYGEKMRSMGAGAAATYEELFAYACPKFVAPNAPDYTNPQVGLGTAWAHSRWRGLVSARDAMPSGTARPGEQRLPAWPAGLRRAVASVHSIVPLPGAAS